MWVYVRPVLFQRWRGYRALTVQRRTAGVFWKTVATLSPQGAATITAARPSTTPPSARICPAP